MLPRIKSYLILDFALTVFVSIWQLIHYDSMTAIMSGLTIFIAFSPICLALSTLIVFHLTKKFIDELGIKMLSGESLINLSKVNSIAFSMSNVITDGNYYITDLVPEGLSQNSLLAYAATVSKESHHNLAQVICETSERRNLQLHAVTALREVHGCGIEAMLNGRVIKFGTPQWITEEKVEVSNELLIKSDQLAAKGKISLMLLMGRMVRGIIALKDEVDVNAQKFLELLKNRNVETTLLSSESKKTVHAVAKNIKVDNVRFALTADGKAREIQLLKAHGKEVAMIGREVIDIPAMINADVSFLLRDERAMKLIDDNIKIDFVIDRLGQFFKLRRIADKVKNIVEQNMKMSYLSWIILVPPALMMITEQNLFEMNPLIATIGVTIFAGLIIANSFKIKSLLNGMKVNANINK